MAHKLFEFNQKSHKKLSIQEIETNLNFFVPKTNYHTQRSQKITKTINSSELSFMGQLKRKEEELQFQIELNKSLQLQVKELEIILNRRAEEFQQQEKTLEQTQYDLRQAIEQVQFQVNPQSSQMWQRNVWLEQQNEDLQCQMDEAQQELQQRADIIESAQQTLTQAIINSEELEQQLKITNIKMKKLRSKVRQSKELEKVNEERKRDVDSIRKDMNELIQGRGKTQFLNNSVQDFVQPRSQSTITPVMQLQFSNQASVPQLFLNKNISALEQAEEFLQQSRINSSNTHRSNRSIMNVPANRFHINQDHYIEQLYNQNRQASTNLILQQELNLIQEKEKQFIDQLANLTQSMNKKVQEQTLLIQKRCIEAENQNSELQQLIKDLFKEYQIQKHLAQFFQYAVNQLQVQGKAQRSFFKGQIEELINQESRYEDQQQLTLIVDEIKINSIKLKEVIKNTIRQNQTSAEEINKLIIEDEKLQRSSSMITIQNAQLSQLKLNCRMLEAENFREIYKKKAKESLQKRVIQLETLLKYLDDEVNKKKASKNTLQHLQNLEERYPILVNYVKNISKNIQQIHQSSNNIKICILKLLNPSVWDMVNNNQNFEDVIQTNPALQNSLEWVIEVEQQNSAQTLNDQIFITNLEVIWNALINQKLKSTLNQKQSQLLQDQIQKSSVPEVKDLFYLLLKVVYAIVVSINKDKYNHSTEKDSTSALKKIEVVLERLMSDRNQQKINLSFASALNSIQQLEKTFLELPESFFSSLTLQHNSVKQCVQQFILEIQSKIREEEGPLPLTRNNQINELKIEDMFSQFIIDYAKQFESPDNIRSLSQSFIMNLRRCKIQSLDESLSQENQTNYIKNDRLVLGIQLLYQSLIAKINKFKFIVFEQLTNLLSQLCHS